MIIASATKVINEYDTMEAVDAANEAVASASKELVAMEHAAIDEETGSVSIFGKDPEGNITSEMELTSRSMNLYDAEDLVASFGEKTVIGSENEGEFRVSIEKNKIAMLHGSEEKFRISGNYAYAPDEGTPIENFKEWDGDTSTFADGYARCLFSRSLKWTGGWYIFDFSDVPQINDVYGAKIEGTDTEAALMEMVYAVVYFDDPDKLYLISETGAINRYIRPYVQTYIDGSLSIEGHNESIGTTHLLSEKTTSIASATSSVQLSDTYTLGPGVWIIVGEVEYAEKTGGARHATVGYRSDPAAGWTKNTYSYMTVGPSPSTVTRLQTSAIMTFSKDTQVCIMGFQSSGSKISATAKGRAVRIA